MHLDLASLFFAFTVMAGLPGDGADAHATVRPAPDSASGLRLTGKNSDELASGVFLIASRKLEDPNFARTVVLLLKYDSTGALGLVINRPSGIPLSAALPEVMDLEDRADTLFVGGPVERGQLFLLIRSKTPPPHAEAVVDGIYASTSLKTLQELISGEIAETAFHAYAGYAGWGAGQLEGELLRGDWLVAPADADTVFSSDPDNVWHELMRRNSGLWVKRGRPGW